jgi:thiamine pyrophosphate-dependent acetolactate synthase large subunit-like protein
VDRYQLHRSRKIAPCRRHEGCPSHQPRGKSKKLAVARFHRGVDISRVASALGAKAYRVETSADIAATLKSAIADVRAGRTAVVDVVTRRTNGSLHHLWDPNARQGGGEA